MTDSAMPHFNAPLAAMVVAASAPLLALIAVGCLRSPRFVARQRGIAVAGCGTTLLAAVVLASGIASDADADPVLTAYEWLAVPQDGLTVAMGLHADRLSVLFLLLAASVATVVSIVAAGAGSGTAEAPASWRLLLPFSAMVLLLLSTNFVQLFLFWRFLTLAADWTTRESPTRPPHGAPRLFLVHLAVDIAFVLGICLIWLNFGTIELDRVLTPGQIGAVQERQPAAIAGICVCLFAGVLGKTGQIPLAIWLPQIARGPASVGILLHAATLLPAGAYCVVRCLPLFIAAPAALSLMAFIGGFTALLLATVAAGQRNLRDVLSFTAAGQFGLIFLGLSTASTAGVTAALFLLVNQALAAILLFDAAGQVRHAARGVTDLPSLDGLQRILPSRWSFLAGSLIAGTAIWGQDAILSAVWQRGEAIADRAIAGNAIAAASADDPVAERPATNRSGNSTTVSASNIFLAMHWLAVLSLALTAFALFRAYYLTFREPAGKPAAGTRSIAHSHHGGNWVVILVMVSALALRACFGEPFQVFDRFIEPIVSPLVSGREPVEMVGLGLPVAMLGIVTAWMLYARPSPVPERIARSIGAIARLSQHGFYLADFYRLLVAFPLRLMAAICRGSEWFVVEVVGRGGIGRIPTVIAWVTRPLQNGSAQLDALAFLLGAAVLLSALLWLRY